MRRLLAYLLAVLIVGSLFFGWGYRRGAASVEMRDSTVTRWVPWPVPVYDTIREPYPVAVREPAAGRMARKLAVRHAQNRKPLVQ